MSTRKPQRVSVSTKPRFVVVTRTGPLASVQSTARVKISSRVFKSPVVSGQLTFSPVVEQIEPTVSVIPQGELVSSSLVESLVESSLTTASLSSPSHNTIAFSDDSVGDDNTYDSVHCR